MADGPSGTEVMHRRIASFYRALWRKQRCATVPTAMGVPDHRAGTAASTYRPATALRRESISRAVNSRHDPRGKRPRCNGPSRVRVSLFTL